MIEAMIPTVILLSSTSWIVSFLVCICRYNDRSTRAKARWLTLSIFFGWLFPLWAGWLLFMFGRWAFSSIYAVWEDAELPTVSTVREKLKTRKVEKTNGQLSISSTTGGELSRAITSGGELSKVEQPHRNYPI